jgi:hypothetical protein
MGSIHSKSRQLNAFYGEGVNDGPRQRSYFNFWNYCGR